MLRVRRTTGLVLAALVAACALAPAASADRAFSERFNATEKGDITFAANTLMTCPDTAPTCAGARNGNSGSDANNNNNAYVMQRVDVDGNATTFTSSSSDLALPAGSTVLFAGLYYSANTNVGTGTGATAPPNVAQRNQLLLDTPTSPGYAGVTASQIDDSTNGIYAGFADVTQLVDAGGTGTYTVANVQSGQRHGSPRRVDARRRVSRRRRGAPLADRLRRPGGDRTERRADDDPRQRVPHAPVRAYQHGSRHRRQRR